MNILEVTDIAKTYSRDSGVFRGSGEVAAVSGVSFSISEGQTVGLVGESGCGKTTIGKMVLKLEKPDRGKIVFCGNDITSLPEKELRLIRKDMQIIFQDPFASLNPRIRIGDAIGEVLILQGAVNVEKKVQTILHEVGLSTEIYNRYPHEFSGGQRQRICIARALVGRPKLVVCDEPVSSLDVSVQAQIINLLKDLKEEFKLTYLFVSHDLRVVRSIADRILVMYAGKIVEEGTNEEIFNNPKHPYTKLLLSSVLSLKRR